MLQLKWKQDRYGNRQLWYRTLIMLSVDYPSGATNLLPAPVQWSGWTEVQDESMLDDSYKKEWV